MVEVAIEIRHINIKINIFQVIYLVVQSNCMLCSHYQFDIVKIKYQCIETKQN